MNKTRIALLVTGPTRPDLLAALPALTRRIGPVKANTFQHASRVVNALRQGEPVRDAEPLRESKVILCAGGSPPEMTRSLLELERAWRGALVIFAGPPEADPAPELSEQNARVATATLLPSTRAKTLCLVSGSVEAAKLLRTCGARVVRASKGSVREYHTASALIEYLLPQVLEEAAGRLRHAGLSSPDLRSILEEQVASSMRSYLRTRKRPAIASELQRLVERLAGDAVP